MAELFPHGDLKIVMEEVRNLTQHPDNANIGDMGALEESIDVNGFYQPIIAQASTGYILAGNHRWLALQRRGAPKIPTIYLDVPDSVAKRIMLADNRTTRLGTDDPHALADALESLQDTDYGLTGSGYTTKDLAELLDRLDRIDAAVDEELPTEDYDDAPSTSLAVSKYTVEPESNGDGECDELIVQRRDGFPMKPSDLNAVRKALGMESAPMRVIMGYGIEGWMP